MLDPAFTGSGVSVLVTARSADVLTVVIAVAVSLAVGSGDVVAIVDVLLMTVAAAVLELTFTTIVNTADSAFAIVGFENMSVPVPPTAVESLRVQPAGVVVDTKVVFAGIGSFIVTLLATAGPLLVTVTV